MTASSAKISGRVLLTGVPGWLTEALLQDLLRDPQDVRKIRCLVQRGSCDVRAIAARSADALEFVEGELRDADSLDAAVRDIDVVVHAAGVVHAHRVRDWYDVNYRGTQALVEAACRAGVGRFVLVSSNAAAGRSDRADRLLVESDPPRPLCHYGRSKLLAEQVVHSWSRTLETVVLRPCMFYGPPVPPRHVEVYRRILGSRMPLVGGGEFARSLSQIDNLVQGCRLAMAHPAAAGQTYYITDRPVYTTLEIVEAMAEALGVAPRYLHMPRVVGPVAHGVDRALSTVGIYWQAVHLVGESDWHVGVSSAKACRELGYDPRVTLADGMRQAVAWCRTQGLLTRAVAA